ncbi:Ras-related protein RABC2a [Zea mays]|uniref:Ras-related protein RABC2a n=1 Tax=Zea mays TaxID=4577 RepID=A0A1D6GPW0_MAIZE|nr:Ras-related protein RABC2a [Zea mays]
MGSPGAGSSGGHECSFKFLLIGDSGVGKSSLLVSFVAASYLDGDIAPTIGVDFKIKFLTVGGKKLKLTIWDTGLCVLFVYVSFRVVSLKSLWLSCSLLRRVCHRAGQERFRTITSSYYRGAQGIILVYDVTKRESFSNLADVWTKEIEANSTNKDCIKMLVGNKVDKDDERMVTKEEGLAFAEEYGCLFLESSAKTRENVEKCFEELALKILEVPSLLEEGSSSVVKRNILKQKQESDAKNGSGCCQ